MSWKDELRAGIAAALGRQAIGVRVVEQSDDERREVLLKTLAVAGKVMKCARAEFDLAEMAVDYESDAGHLLSIEKRFLATTSIMNGLALTVRRETGVVDLLHVEEGIVVDGQRRPIGQAEMYFSRHVVELAQGLGPPHGSKS